MSGYRGLFVAAVLIAQLASVPVARAACSITIAAPAQNAQVGETTSVSGTASEIGAGNRLWLLAHRKDIGLWWPQGGGSIDLDTAGKWTAIVFIGVARDVGQPFEITARAFADTENKILEQWVQKTGATGQYPGIPMPRWLPDCGQATVVVTR